MTTVKLDLHHKSSNWTNASLPVTILVGSGYSGNAIQASASGTHQYVVELVDLYPDLPAISLLNTFQFYTKRAANADNKDWVLKFLLTGFDINNNIQEVEVFVYPRDATNFAFVANTWKLVNQTVAMMDIDDVQYTVAQVKAGVYANFKVKQIIVESESSASFVGEISNIAVAFTGLDAVEFQINETSNDAFIGNSDANVSLENQSIALKDGSNKVVTIDNLNNKVIIKDHDLSIQSVLVSDLNMGGRSIINIANPTTELGVANKGYVDEFFNQIRTQMQWFNSTLNSNTEIAFSSPNSLSSNLSVMTSVYPETLNSTILKLTNSILQLEPGTYRIESVLKISYATMQASPIEFYLQEIDTNGDVVANSQLTFQNTTLRPFGLNQYVTSSIGTTIQIDTATRFQIRLVSLVSQTVTVGSKSSLYINKLFQQDNSLTYSPINTPFGVDQFVPTGSIIAFYGSTAPNNWLICNGSAFNPLDYPQLQALLGSSTLPDLRDKFLRMKSASRAIGNVQTDNAYLTAQTITSAQVTGGTTGADGHHRHWTPYSVMMAGSGQANADIGGDNGGNQLYDAIYFYQSDNFYSSYTEYAGQHTHTINTACNLVIPAVNTTTGTSVNETRPTNVAVNYIIKGR